MDRITHRLIRLTLMAGCLCLSAPVYAICISPTLTPAECDFKDEDTALWWLQPGWKFVLDDKVDNTNESGLQSIEQYFSSVKTTGDAHIRDRLHQLDESMTDAITASTANLGLYLANDPWNLKPLYLDVTRCYPFWLAMNRDCPTTAQLPVDNLRLEEMREVRHQIRQIQENPYLILGEEWGAIKDDFQAIEDQFDRASTLARHIDTDERLGLFQNRFRRYEQMVEEPNLTLEGWSAERTEISNTLNDTLIDSLQAAHQIGDDQLQTDRDEAFRLHAMNRNAIGRMQVFETGNMNRNQSAQAWLKITEQYMNMSNLMALDIADEWWGRSTATAKDVKAVYSDPLRPTIVGNEEGLPMP